MVELNKYLELDNSYELAYKRNNNFLCNQDSLALESLFYNITADVDIILNSLSISASRSGCRYWKDAVFIYITSCKMPISICKDIYPIIGLKYGKTSASVERAMRVCFEDVLYRNSKKEGNYIVDYLQNCLLFPHNSELLMRIVELVVSKKFQDEKSNLLFSK